MRIKAPFIHSYVAFGILSERPYGHRVSMWSRATSCLVLGVLGLVLSVLGLESGPWGE